ncbi:hypothetical protein KBY84_02910 [Cyanobium sp. N.Huapi 1H5]|uniref:hypothetical protein n=1 Tax=Cyanobium sp. N.Huapi 1H5 TaxID=2823719 RepID=UPI0020CF99B1|nr:hypothetical protein [Cyanobium sp. N.Huapi 1H5]MCP9836444.1 hypothetical protein [Cyanobium sp. N.Huapi 1H5]
MSVTTERARLHTTIGPLGLLLIVLLGGCAEEPLPQRPITREDCLRTVKLEDLPGALRQCDRVVAAFPKDPGPLNERFLLHTLAGNTTAACRDIARATVLAAAVPKNKLDPILRQDLEVRRSSCADDAPARPGG